MIKEKFKACSASSDYHGIAHSIQPPSL